MIIERTNEESEVNNNEPSVQIYYSQEDKEFVEVLNFAKKFYLGCLASVGFGLNIDVFTEKKTEFEKHAE